MKLSLSGSAKRYLKLCPAATALNGMYPINVEQLMRHSLQVRARPTR